MTTLELHGLQQTEVDDLLYVLRDLAESSNDERIKKIYHAVHMGNGKVLKINLPEADLKRLTLLTEVLNLQTAFQGGKWSSDLERVNKVLTGGFTKKFGYNPLEEKHGGK